MSTWDSTPHRNLLLPENLERVRKEFENDGVVFGWHYYYAGGGSGTMFTFADYESYYKELAGSRPGDHFTVYSLDRLADRAIARVGAAHSEKPILLDSRFAEVKKALEAGKEIAFVWRRATAETHRVECAAGVLSGPAAEELDEALGARPGRSGEITFFSIDTLDEDGAGAPIACVSAIGGRRRVNAVVDGKRPDEAGLTPASGPY
jgi:hypothetical protein